MNWIQAAADCDKRNQPFVLVTVTQTEGSTPRDGDAKMLVTSKGCFDTIGGGQLEFEAIEVAQTLLGENRRCSTSLEFNLAKDLDQCCGGRVTLLLECFSSSGFNVVVLGAGHVGKAVVSVLGQMPCRVQWMDSRAEYLINPQPFNVTLQELITPEQAIESCSAGSWYLVMTHSHVLDQQLVEAILARGDARYCGLIGSKSKAASFRGRLKRKGFSADEIDGLTSPIGLSEIKGKQPMEIAVSVVAQMMILEQALIEPEQN